MIRVPVLAVIASVLVAPSIAAQDLVLHNANVVDVVTGTVTSARADRMWILLSLPQA